MENVNNIRTVVSQLNEHELKSSLFLLLDFFEYTDQTLISRAKKYNDIIRCPERLEKEISDLCTQTPNLLTELLATLPNYKLLKQMGSCKHIIPRNCRINKFWKHLYSVCEDIDDSEFQKLKRSFPYASNAGCTEQLICLVFIHDEMHLLVRALRKIGRTELCEKISRNSAYRGNPVEYYNVPENTNPYGVAIIINQEKFEQCQESENINNMPVLNERIGSDIDRDTLKKLWSYFGLEVRIYENKKAREVYNLFSCFANEVPTYCHVFVACFLSHGDNGIIYGADSKPIKIEDCIEIIANHCHALNNKPKVFVIQACQGQKHQPGADVTGHIGSLKQLPSFETDAVEYRAPERCDVYEAYSTIPGYVSYRGPRHGSLFISEFAKQMEQFGDKKDIDIVMRKVRNAHAHIQVSFGSNTLRKCLIFKPPVKIA